MTILLGIFTFLLVIVSVIMVLAILAQRAKSDGGVGAALGGGMTEAAFGAESGNVLSKATTWMAVTFFLVSFGLYLGHLHLHRVDLKEGSDALPAIPSLGAPSSTDPLGLPERGLLNLPSTVPAEAPASSGETPTP